MGKQRPATLTGTFDVECHDWTHYLTGATYQPIDGTRTWRSVDAMIAHMRTIGGTWWGWNAGRYDTLLVAERLHRRGVPMQASCAGSALTRLVIGTLTLRDGCSLVPLPLDEAAALAELEAPAGLGWSCVCGADCGGYCTVPRRPSEAQWAELDALAGRDARTAYAVLAAVLTRWTAEGMIVRGTLGGTAWSTAQRWADLPDYDKDRPGAKRQWKIAHRAYYGGRTTIARPTAIGQVTAWDLSSAYGAALATTPLPIGDPVELAACRAGKAYRRRLPGVYLARVDIPTTRLPPLPVRTPSGPVTYPIGRAGGWWVLPELLAAERRGVQVEILEGLVWLDGEAILFADVIGRWYASRLAAGKRTAWGQVYNGLLKSLTGKLGQSPEHETITFTPRTWKYCDPANPAHAAKGCTRRECSGRCGAYRPLRDDLSIGAVPFHSIDKSSHVVWAAYLTAATRIAWLDAADLVGDDLVYGATDSIWTLGREPGPQGEALGLWSHQPTPWGARAYDGFAALAPNTYTAWDEDGRGVYRAGGFPELDGAQWADLTTFDPVERKRLGLSSKLGRLIVNRGVMPIAEAAHAWDEATGGSLFRRASRTLTLRDPTGWYGDRRLDIVTGMTYPVPYGSFYQAHRRRR